MLTHHQSPSRSLEADLASKEYRKYDAQSKSEMAKCSFFFTSPILLVAHHWIGRKGFPQRVDFSPGQEETCSPPAMSWIWLRAKSLFVSSASVCSPLTCHYLHVLKTIYNISRPSQNPIYIMLLSACRRENGSHEWKSSLLEHRFRATGVLDKCLAKGAWIACYLFFFLCVLTKFGLFKSDWKMFTRFSCG